MVGSPGLRGSPWTRSSQRDQSHLNGKAGQGAVRGPGVRPTIFADRPVMGKTSGIGLAAWLAACQFTDHRLLHSYSSTTPAPERIITHRRRYRDPFLGSDCSRGA